MREVATVIPRPDAGCGRGENRQRLYVLDSCLNALESAHERNEYVVSQSLGEKLGSVVPGVEPGMLIRQALELVLAEQQHLMQRSPKQSDSSARASSSTVNVTRLPASGEPLPSVAVVSQVNGPGLPTSSPTMAGEIVVTGAPLNQPEARLLTDRIRTATVHVCLLLLEAHERRAWLALGYSTWQHYVSKEFGLSRSRAYELLDQGIVIRTIQAALCLSGIPDISAYAAAQVKARLPELISVIRTRAAGLSEQDAHPLIHEIVSDLRRQVAKRQDTRDSARCTENAGRFDLLRLQRTIDYLASLPPVEQVIRQLPEDAPDSLQGIDFALRWLQAFAAECLAPASGDCLTGS